MAPKAQQIVISASRRTDVPAFYMDWFMARLEEGFFDVRNPFNHRVSRVPAAPGEVHTIVFWSKDFGSFLKEGRGPELHRRGYNLYFNFTVNSRSPELEPRVIPLEERVIQFGGLCRLVPPAAVAWRFDPLCWFRNSPDEPLRNNLHDFERIAEAAARAGIRRCVTSFMMDYHKVRKRAAQRSGFSFHFPSTEKKVEVVLRMERRLAELGISLQLCCQAELLSALPADSTVTAASCIPNDLLIDLYGPGITTERDRGQRVKAGCGCRRSRDVGDYRAQPCLHRCLYCYANPGV